MIFYVPGGVGVLWCIAHFFLTYDTPEKHQNMSEQEKIYLRDQACVNVGKMTEKEPKVPLAKILTSIPVHALWMTHFCATYVFYIVAINIPIFVNEVFSLGIIYVSYDL